MDQAGDENGVLLNLHASPERIDVPQTQTVASSHRRPV